MSQATRSYVYGLFDPAEQVIRYVGQSIRPGIRLAGHLKLGGRNLREWVACLANNDRYPCMIILEVCDFATVHEREKHWHALLSDRGLPLVNYPKSSHRTTVFRTSKQYKDHFTYQPHCILEPAYRYRMYYKAETESREKLGTILAFVESL